MWKPNIFDVKFDGLEPPAGIVHVWAIVNVSQRDILLTKEDTAKTPIGWRVAQYLGEIRLPPGY